MERFGVSPFYKHLCVFCKVDAAVMGRIHLLDEIFADMRRFSIHFGVAGSLLLLLSLEMALKREQ